jgi:hypothetical protein
MTFPALVHLQRVAGALAAPADAEGGDDGQAPAALVVRVRLARFKVKRAHVACSLPGVVAVRDSEDPDGPVLTLAPDEWARFITRLRVSWPEPVTQIRTRLPARAPALTGIVPVRTRPDGAVQRAGADGSLK